MSQEINEVLEVLEIGQENDFSVDIKSQKPEKIPTKTVSLFLEEMDIRDTINQPFLFIILPFFTSKRQRNVNLIYDIKNAGIKFGASLSSDAFEGFQNKQPSDFEKNVFYFILYKFQELLMSDTEEKDILFDIEEVIEYLGLKFSMKYYHKMEETLYNLQETTYRFRIRNRRKAGNIIREVYKKPLNLIRYEKLKEKNIETNKMKTFYKVQLDERIIEELKIKHYSIFDKNMLTDIRKRDKVAEKIYQFISMKRFDKMEGEYRVETLATIIPLSVFSYIKKTLKNGEVKDYRVSKLKQVLRRLEKAFKILVDMEYLTHYEVLQMPELKTYKIKYYFNPENDNVAHISDLLMNKPNSLKLDFSVSTVEEIPVDDDRRFSIKIENQIKRTKRNIYFSKSYNKRTENKLTLLYKNEGEEFVIELLKKIYVSLKTDIKRSLVSYINAIIKEMKKEEVQGKLDFGKNSKKVEDAVVMEETQMLETITPTPPDIQDPISNLLIELYDKLFESEKEKIVEKAKERYLLETGSSKLNDIHIQIFNSMKKNYIVQIMREEKGL